MSKYINADEFRKTLKAHLEWINNKLIPGEFSNGCRAATNDIIGTIDITPKIDAVEVVRCKECKFAHMTIDGYCKYCDVLSEQGLTDSVYYEDEHYCSDAERKENT